jgi:branched-chain amino acid transport system ATP-binding protein
VRLGASIFTSLPRHLLAQIGVFRSFQEGRLFESLSAAENLAAALRPAPDERLLSALVPIFASNAELTGRRFAMSATLQAIGMEPARDRCAREMSYGMRKRTILGQARVSNSVVCLLDEPLAGIDPVTRDKMISFIATLRNANRIVLFVEHDLDAVRCLADRTLLMDRGRLVGDGLVDEIFAGKAFLEAYLQSYVQ